MTAGAQRAHRAAQAAPRASDGCRPLCYERDRACPGPEARRRYDAAGVRGDSARARCGTTRPPAHRTRWAARRRSVATLRARRPGRRAFARTRASGARRAAADRHADRLEHPPALRRVRRLVVGRGPADRRRLAACPPRHVGGDRSRDDRRGPRRATGHSAQVTVVWREAATVGAIALRAGRKGSGTAWPRGRLRDAGRRRTAHPAADHRVGPRARRGAPERHRLARDRPAGVRGRLRASARRARSVRPPGRHRRHPGDQLDTSLPVDADGQAAFDRRPGPSGSRALGPAGRT